MRIAGFQPLTLLDFPGVPASIVFTQGCFFRCAYCHNPELISLTGESLVSTTDVLDELERSRKIVSGVVITGGEPTIHPDLPEFMAALKERGFLVKLDTNGMHPEVVQDVIDRKLVDYIAMDIKNRWDGYAAVTRVTNPLLIERCRQTLGIIQESGVPHEFRTTVLPGVHTTDDFVALASYLRPGERYFIQDIRYGKTLDQTLDPSRTVDVAALVKILRLRYPLVSIETRS